MILNKCLNSLEKCTLQGSFLQFYGTPLEQKVVPPLKEKSDSPTPLEAHFLPPPCPSMTARATKINKRAVGGGEKKNCLNPASPRWQPFPNTTTKKNRNVFPRYNSVPPGERREREKKTKHFSWLPESWENLFPLRRRRGACCAGDAATTTKKEKKSWNSFQLFPCTVGKRKKWNDIV